LEVNRQNTPEQDPLDFGIVAIHDPEIDVEDLTRRIRVNMARREKLPPLAAGLGKILLIEQRKKLLEALDEVQRVMHRYGTIEESRTGLKGALARSIKRLVRKLCGLSISQQQAVHEQVQRTFTQLAHYLDFHERVICARFDQSDHYLRDTAESVRAFTDGAGSVLPTRKTRAA
jgi:hypothetical protein